MPVPLTRCPVCGNSPLIHRLRVEEANYIPAIPRFDVEQCDRCGVCAMNPMPTESEAQSMYVNENVFSQARAYPNRALPLSGILEPLWMKFGRDLRFYAKLALRFSRRRGRGASVLDIGCSRGILLDTFRSLDPSLDLHGIDIDPDSKAKALPGLANAITIGDVRTQAFDRPFQIVSMRAVIEHIIDVVPYMKHVVSLIEPGGILVLMTPDISSAKARAQGSAWQYVNDPNQKLGHVLWFDRRSLRSLALELGMTVEYLGNRGEAFDHFPAWLRKAMAKLFGMQNGRVITWYPLRLTYALICDALLSEPLGFGECVYAVFRKPA